MDAVATPFFRPFLVVLDHRTGALFMTIVDGGVPWYDYTKYTPFIVAAGSATEAVNRATELWRKARA